MQNTQGLSEFDPMDDPGYRSMAFAEGYRIAGLLGIPRDLIDGLREIAEAKYG